MAMQQPITHRKRPALRPECACQPRISQRVPRHARPPPLLQKLQHRRRLFRGLIRGCRAHGRR